MVEDIQREAGEPAMARKPNKPKAVSKKASAIASAVPIYLALLLLVLGLLGGYAIGIYSHTPPDCPPCPDCNVELPAISMVFLYSDDCPICSGTTTFQQVLAQEGLQYLVDKIETNSEQGQSLIEEFGVKVVPTLLIDASTVTNDMMVTTKEGQRLALKFVLKNNYQNGTYVVGEENLNPTTFKVVYYLDSPSICELGEKKHRIDFFGDYYGIASMQHRTDYTAALEVLPEMIGFEYHPFLTKSVSLAEYYGDDAINTTINYYSCAKELGKFHEFNDAFLGMYCDKDGDEVATESELNLCPVMNEHLDIPFDLNELDRMVSNANIDENAFNECLETVGPETGEFADAFSIGGEHLVSRLPLAVLDCKYLVHPAHLKKHLCVLEPTAEACKE